MGSGTFICRCQSSAERDLLFTQSFHLCDSWHVLFGRLVTVASFDPVRKVGGVVGSTKGHWDRVVIAFKHGKDGIGRLSWVIYGLDGFAVYNGHQNHSAVSFGIGG